jgi:hypothetical protein
MVQASEGAIGLTGGDRFAIVPATCLQDARLSRGARWFYVVLASYADRDGITIHLALSTIAEKEGITVRRIEQWLAELTAYGWVGRLPEQGRAYRYLVARDPAKRDEVIAQTGMAMVDRATKAAKFGAMGAAVRRRHGYRTKRSATVPAVETELGGAKPVSGRSEIGFGGEAKLASHIQDIPHRTPYQDHQERPTIQFDMRTERGAALERTSKVDNAVDCIQRAPLAAIIPETSATRRWKEAAQRFNDDVVRVDGLMAAIMNLSHSGPAWEAAVNAEIGERGGGLRELKENWLGTANPDGSQCE